MAWSGQNELPKFETSKKIVVTEYIFYFILILSIRSGFHIDFLSDTTVSTSVIKYPSYLFLNFWCYLQL